MASNRSNARTVTGMAQFLAHVESPTHTTFSLVSSARSPSLPTSLNTFVLILAFAHIRAPKQAVASRSRGLTSWQGT